MATWRVLVCQARTGVVVDELLPLGDPDWETEIGQKGSWGVQLRLGEAPNFKDSVLDYVTSGAHLWVVCWGSFPVQGGMPTSASFEQSTRTLHVSGAGIGALFDNRVSRTPNGTPATLTAAGNNWTMTNTTQRAYMRELVVKSLGDSDSGASLPFDVSDGAGETGTTTRTVNAWDLNQVWKLLTDETDNNGGCEFIFRPYAFDTAGAPSIGFALRLGNPALGNLALDAAWELNAAFGNIDVDYNLSIPRPHRVWAKGSGDGGAAIIGYAENTATLQAAGVPYADYVDTTHNDASIKATLDGYAAAILNEYSVPKTTWNAEVRIDGKNDRGVQISPELGSWVEGDMPLLRITDHPVIPDGSYRRRIMGMSNGSAPGLVKLKIQELPLA